MRKLKNWKTEKLNYFRKCQVSLPSNISQNNSVFQFFSFSVFQFPHLTLPKIIQFFSFSVFSFSVFQFPHLTFPKIIQFFSFSVFSFSVVQFILHTCIYMYVLKYIYIYLFIYLNKCIYIYVYGPPPYFSNHSQIYSSINEKR